MRIIALILFLLPCFVRAQEAGSITENIRLGTFRLAPNPVADQVTLIPENDTPHMYALFYDAHGRNVLSTDVQGATVVDVRELAEHGAYMVSTVNDRGTTLDVHRLLIAR